MITPKRHKVRGQEHGAALLEYVGVACLFMLISLASLSALQTPLEDSYINAAVGMDGAVPAAAVSGPRWRTEGAGTPPSSPAYDGGSNGTSSREPDPPSDDADTPIRR